MKKNNFLWDDFIERFYDGGYYEFQYKDMFFNVGLEIEGVFKKKEKWIFIVHKHDNQKYLNYSIFTSPDLLIENARIEGKSIKEIWNDIIVC